MLEPIFLNALKRVFLAGALAAFLPAPAYGDIVVLKNGHRLEGRVEDQGSTVVVHTRFGKVKLDRSSVESIIPSKSALDEHHEKVTELEKKIAAEQPAAAEQGKLWFELAQWCAEKQLDRPREYMLRRALVADPDQPHARQALGFLRHQGAWVTGEERHQALGLVKYKDRWVTAEARDEAERAASEARLTDLEFARAEAELKVKQAEAEKLEAEKRLLDAQARSSDLERVQLDREWYDLQRERERLNSLRWYYSWSYPYCFSPVVVQPSTRTQAVIARPAQPQVAPPNHSTLHTPGSGPSLPLLK